MSDFEALYDRWERDAAFRASFRSDPSAALEKAGITLTPAERSALSALDLDRSDAELTTRLSAKNC